MSERSPGEHTPRTATYVYCLARGAEAPELADGPDGMPAAEGPRALPAAQADDLWLVVSTVPLREYDGPEIEEHLQDLDWVGARALAHEQVVEHVSSQMPVVPLKLFTIFRDDERAAAELGERDEELAPVFDRVGGRLEWGVRVHLDPARARAAEDAEERPASGREYLRRKRRQRDLPRERGERAARAVEELYERLAARAEGARREPAAEPATLLLDAAFLVPRADGEAFERLVAAEGQRLGEEAPVVVTLSGPFPPYSFVAPPEPDERG